MFALKIGGLITFEYFLVPVNDRSGQIHPRASAPGFEEILEFVVKKEIVQINLRKLFNSV